MNQRSLQILQPANSFQPRNQTWPPPWGTDHDIGSNLTIHITLRDPAPAQPLYELLLLAKRQVRDRAALLGPTTLVPRRKANPDLTQTIHGGLESFIEPARVSNPRNPGLNWAEFEILTFWLYEYLWVSSNRRKCTFVLLRHMPTGMELNLGFGGIKPLESNSSGTATLPAKSLSQSGVDAN